LIFVDVIEIQAGQAETYPTGAETEMCLEAFKAISFFEN
jgi:hypothetical protein